MVPNPVSGLATMGMGHDAGPCPWLQSVGATVVDCGVLVGLQICQKTLDDEPPETLAVNWTALFTRIVTLLTAALELAAVTVTATGVEFDEQPPAHKVRSISSVPSPAAFMSLPPAILGQIFSGPYVADEARLSRTVSAASSECPAHCESQRRFLLE
jgi:hypothetical protein